MSTFRFAAEPRNISEATDSFGKGRGPDYPIEEKIKRFGEIGLDGVQFHDDAAPDLSHMSQKVVADCANDVKKLLDKEGLFAEFAAARLCFDEHTDDGGLPASKKENRDRAVWRAKARGRKN